MDLSRKMASFEKEYPQIGKPLASVFKFVGGRVSANTIRMVLLPGIMIGNYMGLVNFVPWARVILALWVCVTIGAVSMLFAIRKRVFATYNEGNLKGDVAIFTQKYGEPDRTNLFTLLEHDLEELQKLLSAAFMLASVTVGIYCYSANVTALVVQLVVIPTQLMNSALYQIYINKEEATGPYARPFQQITGGGMMGQLVKIQKADFKVDKKAGKKK
eukprot:m.417350 g.417350  ORF g.417350 m.417350 type:complete len:216 (+) comp30402_c0_seq1:134-781(+)